MCLWGRKGNSEIEERGVFKLRSFLRVILRSFCFIIIALCYDLIYVFIRLFWVLYGVWRVYKRVGDYLGVLLRVDSGDYVYGRMEGWVGVGEVRGWEWCVLGRSKCKVRRWKDYFRIERRRGKSCRGRWSLDDMDFVDYYGKNGWV